MNSISTPLPRKASKAPMRYKLQPRRNKPLPWFTESDDTTTSGSSRWFAEVSIPNHEQLLMPMLDAPIPPHFAPMKAPLAIRPRTLSRDEVSELGLSLTSHFDSEADFVIVDDPMEEDNDEYSSCNSVYLTPKKSNSTVISPPSIRRLVSPSSSYDDELSTYNTNNKLLMPDDF
jgi:hypothetical protein